MSLELRVVGMGNILFRDEGVGVYAAHALRRCFHFEPEIVIEDGGLAGFNIMHMIFDPASVIVLDALSTDAPAGTIFRLDPSILSDLGPSMQPTAHEVDPVHVFKLAAGLGQPIDMVLIGIVPRDASDFSLGLTSELSEAFGGFVKTAAEEIRSKGFSVTQVKEIIIDEIIESLAVAPH